MSRVSTCPHCGSLERFRSTGTTSSKGVFGPDLLPHSAAGRLRVVVCSDCGLTQLFASTIDARALRSSPGWERIADARGPLNLREDQN